MEKIKIKAEELSKIVHEIKYVAGATIVSMRKMHEEQLALVAKAQTLLIDLDKMLVNIETEEPTRRNCGEGNASTTGKK